MAIGVNWAAIWNEAIWNNSIWSQSAGDTTAPTFSVAPAVTPSAGGGTASATIDELGSIYYVIVADGATAPTATEVKNGQASGGGSPLASGSVSGATSISDVFGGLSASTAYDAYFVAEDDETTPNLQASATLVNFTTTASGGFASYNAWMESLSAGSFTQKLRTFLEGQGLSGSTTKMLYQYLTTVSVKNSHQERKKDWEDGGWG